MTAPERATSIQIPDDEAWVVVALPGKGRAKPRRWAWRATYGLYPWYTRPLKQAQLILTATLLERYCELSNPQLRVALLRAHRYPSWSPLVIALRSADHEPDDGEIPDDLVRRPPRRWFAPYGETASVSDLVDHTGAVRGAAYEVRIDSDVVTGYFSARTSADFREAIGPAEALMRQIRST